MFSALGVFHVMRYINIRYLLTYLLIGLVLAKTSRNRNSVYVVIGLANEVENGIPVNMLCGLSGAATKCP